MANIAVGSLNLTALSETLAERIPISGAGDPGVLLSSLGFGIVKVTRVAVTYGSASDQASVISAAVTAASAGDALWFGMGVVKIETALVISKKLILLGHGTIFRTTSNITLLSFSTASAAESQCHGIQFEGNDTGAAQIGLVSATSAMNITNCTFKDFAVSSFRHSGGSATPFATTKVSNCRAFSSAGIGFETIAGGEYIIFNSCGADACGTAWKLAGGNFSVIGCSGTASTTGLHIATGANNGHATVLGGHFNHNTTNLNYDDVEETGTNPLSVRFVGVEFFTGNIIINDDLCFIIGCEISANTITIQNCSRALFSGCHVHGAPTVTGASTANAVWANCYTNDGSAYTG